jgi:hypothetical protein
MFEQLSDYPIHARLTEEEAWEIADSIQVTPSRDGSGPYLGTLSAQPHAAGWFIAARAREDLSDAESVALREFTRAATFVLLTEGPRPGVWDRIDEACFAAHQMEELKDFDLTESLELSRPNSSR